MVAGSSKNQSPTANCSQGLMSKSEHQQTQDEDVRRGDSAPATEESIVWKVGDAVIIDGLIKTEYNGMEACIIQLANSLGRYGVSVVMPDGTRKGLSVKLENMQRAEPTVVETKVEETPKVPPYIPEHQSVPDEQTLVCCRVVAQLDKETIPENLSLFVGGRRHKFKVLLQIDLGQNCKSFACVQEGREDELIVSFSWFNPRSLDDIATLGMKMTGVRGLNGIRNGTFCSLTEEYYAAPGFAECVNQYKKVVLTGFSMGGATANLMAYHMLEEKGFKGRITVVGMGCPRVGSAEFTSWFHRKLHPSSRNIIAAVPSEDPHASCPLVFDPVSVSPKIAEGFAPHPKLQLLYEGRLHRVTEDELRWMREEGEGRPSEVISVNKLGSLFNLGGESDEDRVDSRFQSAWDRTHSVLKYYDILTSALFE